MNLARETQPRLIACLKREVAQALCMLLLLGHMGMAQALEVGEKVPELTLKVDGGALPLASLRGQFVYLDFWATWCAPCRQSFPWMNAMQSKFQDKGLKIVAVNLDESPEASKEFLRQFPANFKIAFDAEGASPRAFGVKGMPTSFLIGKDGTLLLRHAGFRNSDRGELEARLAAALEGAKP